jgi:Protein of unknown function (DUF3237)
VGINVKFVPASFEQRQLTSLWQMGALMHNSGVGELKPKGLQYISQHMADASHQEVSMPEINTRFLFTLALEIQVSSLGDTPYGRRRMFHFDGGSFDGPKLKGKVLSGGGGWSLIRRDDVMEVDARLILETSDNHQIYAAWKGLRHGPKEVMDRLYQGEIVDPGAYYFRTTPYFETSSEKYSWMNRICSIASGSFSANTNARCFSGVVVDASNVRCWHNSDVPQCSIYDTRPRRVLAHVAEVHRRAGRGSFDDFVGAGEQSRGQVEP